MEHEKNTEEQEIDLVQIIQKLWRNRKLLLIITGIFAAMGIMVAISAPNVYTASCSMVPQTSQKGSGGNLGGLAAMAGINLGNFSSADVISPTIYPKILLNVNFQKELIYSKFHFKNSRQPITLYDYFTDKRNTKFNLVGSIRKYTIGLPRLIIGAFREKTGETPQIQSDSSAVQQLMGKERQVVNIVKSRVLLSVNIKEGFISLSASMPEPIAAAELAQKAQELLQKYITKFKIEKVSHNLEFVERSYDEARKNFEAKQIELASFRDANKSFSSAVAKTQEEKLTSEYNLLLSVYTELAKQKEQAKISVTETTPVFAVIVPVVVPSDNSKTSMVTILFVFSLLGFILGAGIILVLPFIEENFIPNIRKYKFIPKIL